MVFMKHKPATPDRHNFTLEQLNAEHAALSKAVTPQQKQEHEEATRTWLDTPAVG
jgi:hypothetical protein